METTHIQIATDANLERALYTTERTSALYRLLHAEWERRGRVRRRIYEMHAEQQQWEAQHAREADPCPGG